MAKTATGTSQSTVRTDHQHQHTASLTRAKEGRGRKVEESDPHLQTNLPLVQPGLGWNRSPTTAQPYLFQQSGFWRIYCPCKFPSSATKFLRCCSASVPLKLFTALLQLGTVPRLLPGQEYTRTDSIDEGDKNVLYVCVSCLEENSKMRTG